MEWAGYEAGSQTKDTCRAMRTRTSSKDPDGCLVKSKAYEEKETEEVYFHFTEDDKDGNHLC